MTNQRLEDTADQKGSILFYGWVVVAVSFVSMAAAYAVWYSFSVFLVAVSHEFNWSQAAATGAFSLGMVAYGLNSSVIGHVVDRFGPRRVLTAGALLLAAGLLASSRVQTVWQFYLAYGVVVALGISSIGSVPNTAIVENWFIRRRGASLGLAYAGIGVGTLAIVPFAQYLIYTIGWRRAYVALAGLVVLLVVPLAVAFARKRPEDFGLLPDGDRAAGQVAEIDGSDAELRGVVDEDWASCQWTVALAVRTRRFWFLLFGLLTTAFTWQSILVHQVSYLMRLQFDEMLTASIVGIVGVAGVGGKVLWKFVADRIGREQAYTLGVIIAVSGIVVLYFLGRVPDERLLYAYALLFGVGYGVSAPLFPAMAADLFQGRRFGAICGLLWTGLGIGSALGPLVSAYLFDRTGSYQLMLIVSIGVVVVSTACFWLAAPRKVRLAPGKARRLGKTDQ